MGSRTRVPPSSPRAPEESDDDVRLGDLLAGRLADVSVDSVDAVREVRERER